MKKLSQVGLLVAVSLCLTVPAARADWDDFVNTPTISGEASIDGSGNVSGSVSAEFGSGSGATAGFGNGSGSGGGGGGSGAGGQAATGDGANTTDTSGQGTDNQYIHLNDYGQQLIEAPARNKSEHTKQNQYQEVTQNVGDPSDESAGASTALMAPQSVSRKPIPSGSFKLGFPGKTGGVAPSNVSPWRGWDYAEGGPPPCSTTSSDFNVVDL